MGATLMEDLPGQPQNLDISPSAEEVTTNGAKGRKLNPQELQRKENAMKAYEKIGLKGSRAMEQGPTAALYKVWQRLDSNKNGLLSWPEFSRVCETLQVKWDLKTAWEDALEIMEMHEQDRLLRERLAASAAKAESTGGTSSADVGNPSGVPLADDDATAEPRARMSRGRARGRRVSIVEIWEDPSIWEDPDIDAEEKERRAKAAAKPSWTAHLRGKDGKPTEEISFRAFVSVYNETMAQVRRKVRMEVKTMFERMLHDARGISKEGFNKLCSRCLSRLYLLAPGWESEKDWALLLDLSGHEGRADDSDMTCSWTEFERWWKHRMGLIEGDTPVIPEFFEFKMEELSAAERAKRATQRRLAAKKLPKGLTLTINGRQRNVDLSSLVEQGFDEQRSGKDLWGLLRPRLRMMMTMRRDWGNIDDVYGHADSSFGQVRVQNIWCLHFPQEVRC